MPEPTCQVKDGAGAYQATSNGVDVTPGNTVTINLVSSAGVSTWTIECLYTDDLSVAATVTSSLTIDTVAKTATFTAPVAGRAYIFRSIVNGGTDANGEVQSSYTTTFGVFTTVAGARVGAVNQRLESNATYGWAADYNALVRRDVGLSLLANFTTTNNTATSTNLTFYAAANEVWEITFKGTVQCSGVGGVKFAVDAPAASTIEGWLLTSTGAITTLSYQRITAISTLTATAAHTVATTPGPDEIRALVTVGATPGAITIQAASVTGGQTTTIFAGATLRARKVATA